MKDLSLSVVIPTCNRKEVLKKCLDALFRQTYPKSGYEIIVINDGSSDGTDELVGSEINRSPCALRYFKQENKGPAAARNVGIMNANGKIILIIGDDIIAAPTLLEEHANRHKQFSGENVAVLGYVTWSPDLKINPLMEFVEQVGFQFGYPLIKDPDDVPFNFFYTANISLKRKFLLEKGLFDEDFKYPAYEDMELGARLKNKGLRIIYNKNAIGWHYHSYTLKKFCERQKMVGRASEIYSKKYSQLTGTAEVVKPRERLRLKIKLLEPLLLISERFKIKSFLFKYYYTILEFYKNLGYTEQLRTKKVSIQKDFVSIVIVNWNGKKYIIQCLEAVFKQTYKNFEVIIIDNGSTDGSDRSIESYLPRIRLIRNQANAGFSKANNQGIKFSKGEFVLLLNTDAFIEPDFLEEAVKAAKSDERIGLVTGKILKQSSESGKKVIDSTGHTGSRYRRFCDRGGDEEDKGQYDICGYVFGVCAACGLYKRRMLEDISIDGEYLDELFFSYYEDVDLGWRAQLRGWKAYYTPLAISYHVRGGSGLHGRLGRCFDYRNWHLMIFKNDSLFNILKDFRQVCTYDYYRSKTAFIEGYLFKSWFGIIRLLPSVIKKRWIIQRKKTATDEYIRKWFKT